MDIKLENLIEKIKSEGVLEAKKASQEIIEKAHQEAHNVVEAARKEADQIRGEAKKDADQFVQSSREALAQASRDIVLNIRERLRQLCDTVFKGEVKEILTPQTLKDLILKIVEKWLLDRGQTIEVLINDKERKQVEELIVAKMKEKASKGIVVKSTSSLQKGFRIGIEGEEVYYEFSDDSIVEALKEMVNPMLRTLIKKEGG